MEFVIAGIFLMLSSIVSAKTKSFKIIDSDEAKKNNQAELFGTILIAGFIFVVGVTGLIAGIYSIQLTKKSTLMLSVLLFFLEVQIRLLIKKQILNEEVHAPVSNAISMLKDAYSIGFFPKCNGYKFLVYACQVIQLIFLINVVIY